MVACPVLSPKTSIPRLERHPLAPQGACMGKELLELVRVQVAAAPAELLRD